MDYFAGEFAHTGFRGGLNWYRNIDRNWELLAPYAGARVTVPALYVAGDRDLVVAFRGMDQLIPNEDVRPELAKHGDALRLRTLDAAGAPQGSQWVDARIPEGPLALQPHRAAAAIRRAMQATLLLLPLPAPRKLAAPRAGHRQRRGAARAQEANHRRRARCPPCRREGGDRDPDARRDAPGNPDTLNFGMTTMTIQVRGRGTLTLPASLREKYRLGEGDTLTVVDLDGAMLLSPRLLVVPRLAAGGTFVSSAKAFPEGSGWPGPRRLSRYSSASILTS